MKFKKIYVEITNRCNLACSFCTLNKRMVQQCTFNQFQKIVNECKPYTRYLYLHVLGEPLLHVELGRLITYAKSEGLQINLTTNGTLLAQKEDLLSNNAPRQINVSLHNFKEQESIDTDTYVKEICRVSQTLSKQSYVSLRFWSSQNNKFDNETMLFLKKINEEFPFSMEELMNKQRVTLQKNIFLHKEEIFVWPTLDSTNESHGTCYGLRQQIAILVDGTVVPCCLDGDGIINLGNIYHSSLKEIVESKRAIEIRQGFENQRCTEELCRKCTFKHRFTKKEEYNETS